VFGEEIAEKLGNTIGMTLKDEYQEAVKVGYSVDYKEFFKRYGKEASSVFSKSKITEHICIVRNGKKVGVDLDACVQSLQEKLSEKCREKQAQLTESGEALGALVAV